MISSVSVSLAPLSSAPFSTSNANACKLEQKQIEQKQIDTTENSIYIKDSITISNEELEPFIPIESKSQPLKSCLSNWSMKRYNPATAIFVQGTIKDKLGQIDELQSDSECEQLISSFYKSIEVPVDPHKVRAYANSICTSMKQRFPYHQETTIDSILSSPIYEANSLITGTGGLPINEDPERVSEDFNGYFPVWKQYKYTDPFSHHQEHRTITTAITAKVHLKYILEAYKNEHHFMHERLVQPRFGRKKRVSWSPTCKVHNYHMEEIVFHVCNKQCGPFCNSNPQNRNGVQVQEFNKCGLYKKCPPSAHVTPQKLGSFRGCSYDLLTKLWFDTINQPCPFSSFIPHPEPQQLQSNQHNYFQLLKNQISNKPARQEMSQEMSQSKQTNQPSVHIEPETSPDSSPDSSNDESENESSITSKIKWKL